MLPGELAPFRKRRSVGRRRREYFDDEDVLDEDNNEEVGESCQDPNTVRSGLTKRSD